MDLSHLLQSLKEAFSANERAGQLLNLSSRASAEGDIEVARNHLEAAYRHSVQTVSSVTAALSEIAYLIEKGSSTESSEASEGKQRIHDYCQAEFVNKHIFRCEIISPPLLKRKVNGAKYKEVFVTELLKLVTQEASKAWQRGAKKYEHCTVAYVQHFLKTERGNTPYYDNDNIAIKAILDSVVPIICHDDAALFCDNIYCIQPSNAQKAEVFVVEDPYFQQWLSLYSHYEIAKKLKNIDPPHGNFLG